MINIPYVIAIPKLEGDEGVFFIFESRTCPKI